jgi:Protein of unknown function (DUF3071)
MQDLRLLGVSEDGTRFLLQTPDGQTYSLRLDERVHAALRGDHARLGQLQIQLDHELRPREIQARIRAGETSEDIASASGVPVEHVRRFEGPILLERDHVANSARATNVRRVTDAAATPLDKLVADRLHTHGVMADDLAWDAWRRDDGRWLVRLAYSHGGRDHRATWLFDAMVHTIEPSDDEARWLTEEERAVPEHRGPPKVFVPRLASVPSVAELRGVRASDETADSDAAAEAAADDDAEGDDEAVAGSDVDLTAAPVVHDASWIPGFDAKGSTDAEAGEEAGAESRRGKGRHRRALRPERLAGSTDQPAERTPASPRRRATVPSWDEILFGSSKPEE